MQEKYSLTIHKKGDRVKQYETYEESDMLIGEDIIGLDANVLVDLVESGEFKQEVREQVRIGVLKIYTTTIALGEGRNVLISKRGYSYENATNSLQSILKEFGVMKIAHSKEGNALGSEWFEKVKKQMHIRKFTTFFNDCKILANLYQHANITVYMTEDQDIDKAIRILKIPIKIRIMGEASQLDDFEVKKFLKEHFKEKHKASRKFQKRP